AVLRSGQKFAAKGVIVFEVRIISGGLVELVRPGVNNGVLVEVVDGGHEAVLEFLFGGDPDVTQDRAGELGKEALDEVEPGAVLGRECEFEAVRGLLGEPGSRLPGDVRGMIVEDQLDRGLGRIGLIDELEKLDEFASAVEIPY